MRRSFAEWLLYMAFLVSLCVLLLFFVSSPSAASFEEAAEAPAAEKVVEDQKVVYIHGVDVEAQEPETYEDWFRANANQIGSCRITHYCAELRPHICGTGDGLTANGGPVIPYWTCAVDPGVIPYGSEVMVDFGDRVAFYSAQDCGPAIKGNRLDLAVTTHTEAEDLGVKEAVVYWIAR